MNELSTLVVIGNGPSLRGFDLTTLTHVDTLGMNAAYRYWERINWYPTHYSCLDPELIATHCKTIRQLIVEEKVKTAFLHGHFLKFFPDAAQDDRFVFLNQFNRDWYGNLGKLYGLPLIESPAFQTSDWSKVTTGAYAVRYGIHLGYQRIGLLGIDLRYVEQIPEATRTEGLQLVMERTPIQNPNYFFDDYQQAGDRFQIPNPKVHNFDLHPASFEVLRDDLVQNQLGVSVVNCNPQSELHARGIFPYRSLQTWLGRQTLDALVVMTQVRECDRLRQLLYLWQMSAFVPFLHMQARERMRLIFSFTGIANTAIQSELHQLYADSKLLQQWFHPPEFHFFELPPGEDIYIKDGMVPLGQKGFASGPNQQFFHTLKALHVTCHYVLLIETDCLPLRPDWLGMLCEQVQNTEFWVMGSHYRGKSAMLKHFARHINGCAIYAVGNPQFMDFVQEWQSILARIVANENPIVAYDSALDYFFYYEFGANKGSGKHLDPGSKGWQLFQQTAAHFRYTDYILNYSDAADQENIQETWLRELRQQHDSSYLIHNRALWNLPPYQQLLAPTTKTAPITNQSNLDLSPPTGSIATTVSVPQPSTNTNSPLILAESSDHPSPLPTAMPPEAPPSQPKSPASAIPQALPALHIFIRRMFQGYSHKTGAIAVLALVINAMSGWKTLPQRWIWMGTGTLLLLLLIGKLSEQIGAMEERNEQLEAALKQTQKTATRASQRINRYLKDKH